MSDGNSAGPEKGRVMFVVGKEYDFELLDGLDNDGRATIATYPRRRVVDVDGPLVKTSSNGEEVIINTSSSIFVRARLRV